MSGIDGRVDDAPIASISDANSRERFRSFACAKRRAA